MKNIENMPLELQQVLESNQFLGKEDYSERVVCSNYISYKVLRALYELCKEDAENDLTWDDCVLIMRTTEKLRKAAEAVIFYTMSDFIKNSYFDFKCPEPLSLDDDEPGMNDGKLLEVQLFSEEVGVSYIDFFFLKAELTYFMYQLNAGKSCTWKEYLLELQENRQMWDTLVMAFQDALGRLDFKIGWLAEDLEEVQFLHQARFEE